MRAGVRETRRRGKRGLVDTSPDHTGDAKE